jgi:hypothetical protein
MDKTQRTGKNGSGGGMMERDHTFLDNLERGMYFNKKSYSDTELKTFEEVQKLLPHPILPGREEWTACYWYALKTLFKNQHVPTKESGYVSNFVDAAFNENIFLWDTAFMTMFCNLIHPYVPGIRSLDNFYSRQFDDGEIPREMVRDTGKDFLVWVNGYDKPLYSYFHNHYGHRRLKGQAPIPYEEMYKPDMGRVIEKNPYLTLDNLNHPILAMAEWESYCHTKEIDRLKLVLEPLCRYYAALKYHLRHANGLYVTDWASMDNSPRNRYLGLAIDTSCEMVLFARNILDIMDELEKNGMTVADGSLKSELREDISVLSERINSLMWNDEDGFYYDLTFDGDQTGMKTIAAYWALVSGVADPRQARLLAEWLNDRDTFNRPHRVPVLAANEEGYDPEGGYWKGSVWAPTNTMVVLGLEKNGYHDLAREIGLNHLDAVSKVFTSTGTIWENYPADSITSGNSDKKDFVGWSGMGPIMFLLRYGIGLRSDIKRDLLVWDISNDILKDGPIGCKNYWFFGITADFMAHMDDKKLKLEVNTSKPFELEILFNGKKRQYHVDGRFEVIFGDENEQL